MRNDNIQELGERQREDFVHQSREALFDMEQDPAESNNLIDEPALQEIANEMRRKVIEFRQKTKDPWLEQSFQEGETQPYLYIILH